MQQDIFKEVLFGEYCKTCKYEKSPEYKDPCDECMESPCDLYSHKPINWEEK